MTNKIIDDKNPFHADQLSVLHNEGGFLLDFKKTVPQIDITESGETISTRTYHDIIILNPIIAKSLLEILKNSIDQYEKAFGKVKINKPKKNSTKAPKEHKKDKYIGWALFRKKTLEKKYLNWDLFGKI